MSFTFPNPSTIAPSSLPLGGRVVYIEISGKPELAYVSPAGSVYLAQRDIGWSWVGSEADLAPIYGTGKTLEFTVEAVSSLYAIPLPALPDPVTDPDVDDTCDCGSDHSDDVYDTVQVGPDALDAIYEGIVSLARELAPDHLVDSVIARISEVFDSANEPANQEITALVQVTFQVTGTVLDGGVQVNADTIRSVLRAPSQEELAGLVHIDHPDVVGVTASVVSLDSVVVVSA